MVARSWARSADPAAELRATLREAATRRRAEAADVDARTEAEACDLADELEEAPWWCPTLLAALVDSGGWRPPVRVQTQTRPPLVRRPWRWSPVRGSSAYRSGR